MNQEIEEYSRQEIELKDYSIVLIGLIDGKTKYQRLTVYHDNKPLYSEIYAAKPHLNTLKVFLNGFFAHMKANEING